MTLTNKELERLIGEFMVLVSKAKQTEDNAMEQEYTRELKLLKLAYADRRSVVYGQGFSIWGFVSCAYDQIKIAWIGNIQRGSNQAVDNIIDR